MKKMVFVSFTLFTVCSLLYAHQQRPSQQASKASIEIAGVTLHLGMAQPDIAERFVGTQIQKMGEDAWMIGNEGEVRFKSKKLVYADRWWTSGSVDEVDALFAAIKSLNTEGFSFCRVQSETKNSPVYAQNQGLPVSNVSIERVSIDCGQKSVLVTKLNTDGRLSEAVIEQLGSFDPGTE